MVMLKKLKEFNGYSLDDEKMNKKYIKFYQNFHKALQKKGKFNSLFENTQ